MWRDVPLCCPICDGELNGQNGSLRCAQAHTFDVARAGYVNLLVLRKTPKILGDGKEMLRARHAFLQAGYYAPLSDAVNAMAGAHWAEEPQNATRRCLVDAGCGTGYYLGRLHRHLHEQHSSTPPCCGLDIAKEGVRLAAKQHKECVFVVADVNRRIPLPHASAQVLLNLFAPRHAAEFARIVAPGGLLLVVIPTPEHLIELRAQLPLLDIPANKRTHVREQFQSAFHLADVQTVRHTLDLSGPAVVNLIQMTPNYWHLTEQERAQLDTSTSFSVTVSVELLAFVRQ